MSCPESHRYFEKKPQNTRTKTYIWREGQNNPNLYCWIPAAKKNVNVLKLNLDTVKVQDIPPPPDFVEHLEEISERAEDLADSARLRKLEEGTDVVSSDDPSKYPVVKDFIKRKGLKLYGGAAIDMYMPTEDKFYDPNSIPDYDMYSPSPWKDAVELANIMYKQGYKYSEVRAGIHKGTYKVFANFWPVADITYMERKWFDRLETKILGGIKVASPSRLLENMYKELIAPYGMASRWPKVAERQKLLLKWENPIKDSLQCAEDIFLGGKKSIEPPLLNLLENTAIFIREKKLIHEGALAYNTYMAVGGARRRLLVDHYEVLSENAHSDIQELLTKLLPTYENLVVTTYINIGAQINNLRYAIFAKINETDVPVCFIYQLSDCTPYKFIIGRYVTAIDYIKYRLYTNIVFGETKEIKDAKCKLKYLNKVQILFYKKKKVTEFDDTPFQRFVINCKGPVTNTLKQTLLSRWIDRVERRKKGIKGVGIAPECKGLSEEKCEYPCDWQSERNRCTNVPKFYQVRVKESEDSEDE